MSREGVGIWILVAYRVGGHFSRCMTIGMLFSCSGVWISDYFFITCEDHRGIFCNLGHSRRGTAEFLVGRLDDTIKTTVVSVVET